MYGGTVRIYYQAPVGPHITRNATISVINLPLVSVLHSFPTVAHLPSRRDFLRCYNDTLMEWCNVAMMVHDGETTVLGFI